MLLDTQHFPIELLFVVKHHHSETAMARGHQKELAQAKNKERAAKLKKGGTSQKASAAAALTFVCVVCKVIRNKLKDSAKFKQRFSTFL